MEKTVQIYYTSDTHGHIFPVNYAANCSEKSGLLNLADQMEKDGNTLVLDGGDSLQGTPLTQYYLENRGRWPVHPVAAAFNATCGCVSITEVLRRSWKRGGCSRTVGRILLVKSLGNWTSTFSSQATNTWRWKG